MCVYLLLPMMQIGGSQAPDPGGHPFALLAWRVHAPGLGKNLCGPPFARNPPRARPGESSADMRLDSIERGGRSYT